MDGYGIDQDCDDDNPNVLIDCDLDGLNRDEDCDDTNPIYGSDHDDCDGDGLPAEEDCKDNDPTETSGDCDGDGIFFIEDCNDFDATIGNAGISGQYSNCIAPSCRTLLENGDSHGSGLYWIHNAQDDLLKYTVI